MTAGRLTGDRIVQRLGGANIIVCGGLCAAAGFALATLVPAWPAAVLGFALVGAGCSNVVPVLFTSVGRQTVMPESVAVPAITTLGYAGILAGPAAIGVRRAGDQPFGGAVRCGGCAGWRGRERRTAAALIGQRATVWACHVDMLARRQ